MKNFHQLTLPILFVLIGFVVGCNQPEAEKMGDAAKKAAEDVTSAATNAAEAAGDAAGQMAESLGETFAAAAGKAATALKDVEGGGALLQDVQGFFDTTRKSLQGITDGDSANAALAKLSELSGSLDGWSQLIDKLPSEAKSAVQAVISQGVTALKTVADKVMAIPGVSDVLRPKLDEMMNKLQSFAG